MISTGLAHQAPPMASALGSVRTEWHLQRIKDVAIVNRSSLAETTDPDYLMRYADIGSVDRDGSLAEPEDITFRDAPSRARRLVCRGDTIVSTVRTYLRGIAYIDTDPTDLIVSTGFATVTPGPEVDQRFLFWWLRSTPFVEEIVARSVGVSLPGGERLGCGGRRHRLAPDSSAARDCAVPGCRDRTHRRVDRRAEAFCRATRCPAEQRPALAPPRRQRHRRPGLATRPDETVRADSREGDSPTARATTQHCTMAPTRSSKPATSPMRRTAL